MAIEIFANVGVEAEDDNLLAYFTDPMGNVKKLMSNGRIFNNSGILKSINDIDYMVDRRDVKEETGNTGSAHYANYLKKRINQAKEKSNNNAEFAKNLNTIFKTYSFREKEK